MLFRSPVEVGLARKHARPEWNRFEDETLAFHLRVRAAYRAMASADPERWRCFDASGSPEALADAIWATVAARMGLEP